MAKITEADNPDLSKDPKTRKHQIQKIADPSMVDPLEEEGDLEDITIQPAANGYSVRTSHKVKSTTGHDYHHKNHVFPDAHSLISHLTARLK